ncbi:succinylglutamate desuccinylase/aspartoacylase family protein [Bacteriovorax sp. DB6_IX]|uniref:succinylglutamate desuccinylase/aspartoacylase family protein n=1 Tax=Bacteriovorax sp. DB6_IX TaxID=1353530 RepID=UPI00038A2F47|nr:succinylglutamate desuccinylase/aspartoacylase family protein [Bacteriovorax sp. DB6_IX]EQC50524.1 succinylglutamate desuccinylase/aspartoacylase family protein [Bacteriovorax sp. DB6_IX]
MKKEIIKIDEVVSSPLNLYKYELTGISEGKTVYIQANVHGAEVQGNAVIYKLIEKLKNISFSGKIIFVPQANPYGIGQKAGTYTHGRFNPVTGDNWNRMYIDFFKLDKGAGKINLDQFVLEHGHKSEEEIVSLYKDLIAQKVSEYRDFHMAYGPNENKNVFIKLQELASQADIVLDLHTAPVGTRYIYSPEYLRDKCVDINFAHYIIIPNEFGGAMDEATFNPWIKLYDKLKEKGRVLTHLFEAYTVELGGEEYISMSDAEDDADNILNLLSARGVLNDYKSTVTKPKMHFCPLKDYKMYRAPHAGLVEYHVGPGQEFKANDLLATLYRFDRLEDLEASKTEIRANTRGIVINHIPTSNVKMGMDLIECFTYLD